MTSCIYKIINLITNKIYIGSAVNKSDRFRTHIYGLKNNKHKNRYLQSAYDKYGAINFKFEIIEIVENKEKLLEREQHWMDFYESYNREFGYNLSPTAGSMLGHKHSPETRKKLSNSHTGKTRSEEHKASMRGRKASDEARAKMSKFQRSKIVSKETVQRMCMAQKGKIITEETKLKLSVFNKGKKLSEETKAKIKAAILARPPMGIETRAKIKAKVRKFDKWPHADGQKCKCEECMQKKRDKDNKRYIKRTKPLILTEPPIDWK